MENVTSRMSCEELVRIALQRYQDGEVGMRGALRIMGLSMAQMIAEANKRGALLNCDEADLESDAEALQ